MPKKLFVFILMVLGLFSYSQNQDNHIKNLNVSLQKLKQQLQNAKAFNDSDKIAQSYVDLGNFFTNIELYSEAIKNYHAFQNVYTVTDTASVYVENALASIHLNLKKYNDAKIHATKSLELSKILNYKKGIANTHAILGSIAEKQHFYNEALKHQNISLVIFETLKDSIGLAVTNENIGSIHEDLEQFDLAYRYFKKAQHYSKNCNTDIQINILNNLGDVKRKTHQFKSAITYTNQALNYALKTNNVSQIESAYKDLARTYAITENYEQAYNYLNHQSIVNEQELKRKTIEVVSSLEVLHAVKEKEAEILLLNKNKQVTEVRQYIILICAGSIILALIGGFIYWKKRKQHEQHLLEYKQQLLQVDLDKKIAQEAALQREIEIKVSSLTNYSLNIAHKNKMLSDVSKTLSKIKDRNIPLIRSKLKSITEDIEADLAKQNEWTELQGYFSQIHPNFFENLNKVALEPLSSSEMRLTMLLRLNLNTKEISNILHITTDSVRIARYRLRKKLPLDSKAHLQTFLLKF